MASPATTPITCPNCRQPFSAVIEQLIDVKRDPQSKVRLLSGRLNAVTCPHCGFRTAIGTPLIYHDADKQLLVTYIPMELNLPLKEQERVMGSFTNAVINSLPTEQRKGYLFTPKTALTFQSLIDIVLESDGVTPEMLAAQREKMQLVEVFLQSDPAALPALVTQYDAQLDAEFFAMMLAAADTALANGRRDVAEQVIGLRDQLVRLSTTGQGALAAAAEQQATIDEVSNALNALGDQATREDLISLVLSLAHGANGQIADEKLQVFVGLARPAMDYQFFQQLTDGANGASAADKQMVLAVRDRLNELVGLIDQQNEATVRQATQTLNAIVSSPDLDAALEAYAGEIDDAFLQVLSYNAQAAQQSNNTELAERLNVVFERVIGLLQASAPPAIQFINQLMSLPTFAESRAMLAEHAAEFGPELLQWFDTLLDDLTAQGSAETVDKLGRLRDEAERILANSPAPVGSGSAASPAPSAQPPQQQQRSTFLAGEPPAPNASGAPKIELLPGRDRNKSRRER